MARPEHLIALGFGSGLAPVAPGTFGSLAGWASFELASPWLARAPALAVLVVAFVVGIWACGRTGRDLGVPDHGAMVWDEIVAIWLVLLFTAPGLVWHSGAFLLFRLFDITKPAPIGWLDRHIKGGLGVMADDLLAALYALALLSLAELLWGRWHG